MVDPSVTSLYRKVVSPSVKFHTEGLQKETHARHLPYNARSSLALRRLAASPTLTVSQPYRHTYSAPGRVENRNILAKRSDNSQKEIVPAEANYDFHPTTRFKTTTLPAMPMTSRYAHSVPGTARSVPISAPRHSALSLPDKSTTADINPRILFTSQKERQQAEEQAKVECRRLKRKSEIISHRVDRHYYLCGNKIPVKSRWDVDSNDLLRLKLLAHHKQLAQYQAMKEGEIHDSRNSPSGQMSSPTPTPSTKGFLSSGQQSPRESEGKWAEDTKSETSSINDDDIIAMQRRKAQLSASTKDSTDDTKLNKENENEKSNDESIENSTSKETFITESATVKDAASNNIQDSQKDSSNQTEKVDKTDNKPSNVIKPSSSKSTARKVKNLRFQDEVVKTKSAGIQRRAKSGTNKDEKKGDENKEEKKEQDENHVNPYMDQWLGIKKKEVDERYKPGKPPPNRIFISSEITKSKKTQAAKFSDMFLNETIDLHKKQVSDVSELPPEIRYGIIGEKQKEAFGSMFNEIDKDKNGSVTLEELKLKMMPGVSREDIKHFVQVFDLNKDKTVDSREFTAICCLNDMLSGTRTETADGSIALELEKLAQHIIIFKEMYKTMDEDDDNRLDVNEVLVMVSAAMGTEMGADLADARKVLSAARDEFGYIDFVGFMSYIPFFAKLLRAIMQNPLSINEIEKARERVKQRELTFKPKVVTKKEPKSWEAY